VKVRRISLGTASRFWWLPLVVVGSLRDRGWRIRWLCVPGLVAGTALISTAGKLTIRRPRPSRTHHPRPIERSGLASSFPSTHTACAFVMAGWMRRSPRSDWLNLLAATVGYARVYRRAHYPGDVVVGGTVGYTIGWCADWTWTTLVTVSKCLRSGDQVPPPDASG
jgi:membrane-associated phospholipid phosphatase